MPNREFVDEILTCNGCGGEFTWTAGEQEFYARKSFPPPKKCRACREGRKRQGVYGMRTMMVDAITREVLCSRCSAPASRRFSMRNQRALCPACAGLNASAQPPDLVTVEEWITFIAPIAAQRG